MILNLENCVTYLRRQPLNRLSFPDGLSSGAAQKGQAPPDFRYPSGEPVMSAGSNLSGTENIYETERRGRRRTTRCPIDSPDGLDLRHISDHHQMGKLGLRDHVDMCGGFVGSH
jgi:hypothetical protein